jgi:hypothetical protein
MQIQLDELMKYAEIATPCSANWDEMTGDENALLCAMQVARRQSSRDD